MAASFKVYIDESGDEGFQFANSKTSEWFVLSAVVFRAGADPALPFSIVDDIRQHANIKPKKKVRFRRLKPPSRTFYAQKIGQSALRTITVAMHKPDLHAATFTQPNILYFYATRFLIERVSWLCRSQYKPNEGDGRAEIVFDQRTGMEYAHMRTYFSHLKARQSVDPTQIDWNVIEPSLVSSSLGGKLRGLQVADGVCGAFFCALDSKIGQGCHTYAHLLKGSVYSHRGKRRGYGLKVFPMCGVDQAAQTFVDWWG